MAKQLHTFGKFMSFSICTLWFLQSCVFSWKRSTALCVSQIVKPLSSLVHHNAATRNAAMHNAIFSHCNSYPLFYSVIAVMPFPVFQHRPRCFFTSRTSPFRLCFQNSFRHNGLLYKTRRNLPRVTTQRCRHWQRGMAIANANANAAMRCTKLSRGKPQMALLKPTVPF